MNISVVDEVQSYPYFVNISLVSVQLFQYYDASECYNLFINKTPPTSSLVETSSPSCRSVYPGKV